MNEDFYSRKNKAIFNNAFTFPILSRIYSGFRPSQIAEQLRMSPQAIHHHTDNLIDANLIYKDTTNGIRWKLTDKGLFILKQKLTGSLNYFNNYQTKPVTRLIPTRLDNICIEFKILSSIPEDHNLHWNNKMKNGVSKCIIKNNSHTIELVKSEKSSVMLIHLDRKYCFDWTTELITQYNLALYYAKQTAVRYRLEISEYGRLVKRPHIAFEQDLIPLFIAASNTAEIKTKEAKEGPGYRAWIDSSNGAGELETNDSNYAYNYLMMPQNINSIYENTDIIRRKLSGYSIYSDPILTYNN